MLAARHLGTSFSRRAACVCLGVLALGAAAAPQRSGSYMGRAWLLIGESSRANDFLGQHVQDRELTRLVAQSAEARLQAATDTNVPAEVTLAHPHLLLMLEHYERAATAAGAGEARRYHELCRLALDEEQLFRGVLRQLGWTVPGRS